MREKISQIKFKDTDHMINDELDLHGYFCVKPFKHFEINQIGDVNVCCPSYLPYRIGNILEQSIEEVWNGPKAIAVRESILDGTYSYCHKKLCPFIQQGLTKSKEYIFKDELLNSNGEKALLYNDSIMELPQHIVLSHETSCNLWCPSCRTEKILYTKGPVYDKAKIINDKIIDAFLTKPTDRHFAINPLGDGDPFASKLTRNMLYNIEGNKFPNLKIFLATNGLMFTEKAWNKMHKIHHNLSRCDISIDASTKETYEQKTRLGGNWELLFKNLDFLNSMSANHRNFIVAYRYVVQTVNYKEMSMFAKLILARYSNVHQIFFTLVNDWGTWNKEEYESRCMWKTTHPEYEQFLDVLKDPIFDNPKIFLGNISKYRNEAQRHI